jgi:hypothetical protein
MANTAVPHDVQQMLGQQRRLALGLLWGALMLGLWTAWLYVFLRPETGGLWAVWLGAALTVGLGFLGGLAWYAGRQARQGPAEGLAARLAEQRQRTARGLLLAAVLLLVLVSWSAAQRGLTLAFPLFLSGLLLVCGALGLGLFLWLRPALTLDTESLLGALAQRRLALLAILGPGGVLLLIAAVVLLIRLGLAVAFPEILGLALIGLLLIGTTLGLVVTAAEPLTPSRLRYLILGVGGCAGITIALLTIVRAIVWWNEVFAAGLPAWRGEGAWRLWACFYAELFGLALTFASLLLAWADIRTDVTLRRLLFGYITTLNGLLLLALLAVVNVTVYAWYPYTFEWTRTRGLYSLSEKSKSVLEKLDRQVTIYVVMSPLYRDYDDVRTLLRNIQEFTRQVRVIYINPDQDLARFKDLLQRYPKMAAEKLGGARGLLVVYGDETKKGPPPPHAFIAANNLSGFSGDAFSRRTAPVREFKGEDLLLTELRFLSRGGERPKIYFTQSNGELNIQDSRTQPGAARQAAGLFAEHLRKERYEVYALRWGPPPTNSKPEEHTVYSQKDFDSPHVVPADALALVLLQPQTPLAPEVLDALGKYLDNKGKLLFLSNLTVRRQDSSMVLLETGLENFLRKYGVSMGKGYLLHVPLQEGDVPQYVLAQTPDNSENPIAIRFQNVGIPLEWARPMRPESSASNYQPQGILEVNPRTVPLFWEETDLQTMINPLGYLSALARNPRQLLLPKASKEPIPVGQAVKNRTTDQPVLVALGDASMASNEGSPTMSRGTIYYDFLVSCLEWLAGRPQNIGIEPRKTNYYTLTNPDNIRFSAIVVVPAALLLLGVAGLGAGVWIVRRQ